MAQIELIVDSLKLIVPGAIYSSLPQEHVIVRREREADPLLSSRVPPQSVLRLPRSRLGGVFLVSDPPISQLPDLESFQLSDFNRDGIEALAWYRSYHSGESHKWGIKMFREGIYYTARSLQNNYHEYASDGHPTLDALDFLQAAFNLLQLHEYFHFVADIACTLEELSLHEPLYNHYLAEVYHQENNKFEEAIANAYASRMMQRQGISEALRMFMVGQPGYYKEYGLWTGRRQFQYGRQKLAGLMCPGLTCSAGVVAGSELLFRIDRADLDYQDVPTYIESIHPPDRAIPSLRVVQKVKHLKSTDKFNGEYSLLPQTIQMKVEKAKYKLEEDLQDTSLSLDKLRGYGPVFACRIDTAYSMTVRYCGDDTWELLRVGRSRDVRTSHS